MLKVESENVDAMVAFANFLYSTHTGFPGKMNSEKCVGVGV